MKYEKLSLLEFLYSCNNSFVSETEMYIFLKNITGNFDLTVFDLIRKELNLFCCNIRFIPPEFVDGEIVHSYKNETSLFDFFCKKLLQPFKEHIETLENVTKEQKEAFLKQKDIELEKIKIDFIDKLGIKGKIQIIQDFVTDLDLNLFEKNSGIIKFSELVEKEYKKINKNTTPLLKFINDFASSNSAQMFNNFKFKNHEHDQHFRDSKFETEIDRIIELVYNDETIHVVFDDLGTSNDRYYYIDAIIQQIGYSKEYNSFDWKLIPDNLKEWNNFNFDNLPKSKELIEFLTNWIYLQLLKQYRTEQKKQIKDKSEISTATPLLNQTDDYGKFQFDKNTLSVLHGYFNDKLWNDIDINEFYNNFKEIPLKTLTIKSKPAFCYLIAKYENKKIDISNINQWMKEHFAIQNYSKYKMKPEYEIRKGKNAKFYELIDSNVKTDQ